MKSFLTFVILALFASTITAQNSMVGDGFGGRLWYTPTNYTTGSYSAYSICQDEFPNQLYGWGANNFNQLGFGQSAPGVFVPSPIPNMTNVKYFSTGYIMGAIKNDNTGWAWGRGISGNPIQVISNAYYVDASSTTISFVKNDGTVWSIGYNNNGTFGNGTFSNNWSSIPIQMQSITNAVRVANNNTATIILLNDSSVWSTGKSPLGTLGLGPFISQSYTPTKISGLPKIIEITSNANATIALSETGNVYTWGSDNSNFGVNYSPVIIPNLNNIVAISGCDDGYHFMALDSNNNCYIWGLNLGQLGISSSLLYIQIPQLVATNVIDIMAGENFSYYVKNDGTLWCSGESSFGGSIWLNLANFSRIPFTQIDPSQVPEACPITRNGISLFENIINDSIYFPNVFTPNADGNNDVFLFPNSGIEELTCIVYNRWGTEIYKWSDVNGFWDGRTTAGKECTDGVYYYIVSYKKQTSEDWEKHTGYVSLLR